MKAERLLASIKSAKIANSDGLEAQIESAIAKVEGSEDDAVKQKINGTLEALSEALKGKEEKEIATAVRRFRSVMARLTMKESKQIPMDADFFTPGIIGQIEEQLGEEISAVQTQDPRQFTVEDESGEAYTSTVKSLFQRLMRNGMGKTVGEARAYLALRKTKTHKEAMQLIGKEQKEKEQQHFIPADPELLCVAFIKKIEEALGKDIDEIPTSDVQTFTIEYKGNTYQDSMRYVYTRVSREFLNAVSKPAMGRNYLVLRRNGKSHKDAISNLKKQLRKHEIENHPPVPIDADFLNAEAVHAIEAAIGKRIGTLSADSQEKFVVEINGDTFEDTPLNLFRRVAYRLLGKRQRPTGGRAYLQHIGAGMNPDEARELALESSEEVAIQSPPNVAETYSLKFITNLESILGKPIEKISVLDETEFEIKIASHEYKDSPNKLFARIANKFFDSGAPAKGREYLSFRKQNYAHDEAVAAVNEGEEVTKDKEFEKLAKLELEEAIALLQSDPLKLKLYMQFAHPEMSEQEIDHLIIRSFKGLITGANDTKENEYLGWDEGLENVKLKTKMPKTTAETALLITGKALGSECVYVAGCWNRRVRVEPDGTFSLRIPLKVGEANEIRLMGLDRKNHVRSSQQEFVVEQEGDIDDVAALVELLSGLRGELLDGIRKDPGRMKFFVACAEKVLIKKFGRSFEDGKRYVTDLAARTDSDVMRKVLTSVLKNFEGINRMKLPNVREGSLMFFQKYCVYAIRQKMKEEASGVILANDPGLGKTRTVLAALAEEEAAVFTPNSVVSAWDEEASEMLEDPELLVLRDLPHETRKQLLRNGDHLRLVTNVQFLRKTKDAERFALLSNENTVVVHDESHSRANEQSEQSRGAKMLKHKFQINVSATPFKNPKTLRRILAILEPDDPRFQSDKAFDDAFPARDPEALKALSLLKDKYTIRFRKQDVMEEVDPTVLLSQQPHRLPRKEYVSPQTLGQYEMSEAQAEAIYELFLNWPEWCRKYDKYIPDDEIAEEDHLRTAAGLTKRHALRQTVNNPEYVGSQAEDAKAWQTERIVKKCIKEGRKVVIFCGYNAQALKYAEMFKQYNPALYIGLTSSQGEKKNGGEQPMKFAREKVGGKTKRGWVYDANGYPKEDPEGETMQALDYERLTFQNADDRQIIISTYKAGAVGTTFTAGKAMIFDDLPADCIEAIQAEDRIHRIDPHHQTKASVQYYHLLSRYPQRFLDKMKKKWVVKQEDGTFKEFKSKGAAQTNAEGLGAEAQTAFDAFFAQGTFDQVQFGNLQVQKQMFHLINDGIADETILEDVGGLRV